MSAAEKYPNLKPWPKGTSGNPSGKAKALLTKDDVERVFQAMGLKTTAELLAIVDDPNVAQLEKTAARTWIKAGETGDMSEIRRILDTSIGKLVDTQVTATVNTDHSEIVKGIATKDLLAMVATDPDKK